MAGASGPATVIIAHHTLLVRVGEGAYGEVWLARNQVGLYRAMKIIRRARFADDGPYEREFRGIEKFMPISLDHPGLLRVLHVGRDDPERYFFYVMEAADDVNSGPRIDPASYSPRSLASDLDQRGRLPLAECITLAQQLAAALVFLHDHQLIHRDLKPSNIIFVEGVPKIADIGLVTDLGGLRTSITWVGTPAYMPPEGPGQAAGDVYSLGKIIYEAWTGLEARRFPELPAEWVTPRSEPALILMNRLLLRACETDPTHRFQTVREMQECFQELQGMLATKQRE